MSPIPLRTTNIANAYIPTTSASGPIRSQRKIRRSRRDAERKPKGRRPAKVVENDDSNKENIALKGVVYPLPMPHSFATRRSALPSPHRVALEDIPLESIIEGILRGLGGHEDEPSPSTTTTTTAHRQAQW